MKVLQPGQTIIRMIGYVRKDRNLSTFRNRNENVTDTMIAQGIEEHTSLKMCYTDGKIVLTKANLFSKAYNFWSNTLSPQQVTFSNIMIKILNNGNHVMSATILMNGSGQMRRSAAEVYWAQIMGREITEYEVRYMLYQPKGFCEIDYLPNSVPEAPHAGLFGESDEEEAGAEDEAEAVEPQVGEAEPSM